MKSVLGESIAWLLWGLWHKSLSPTLRIYAFRSILESLETLPMQSLPFIKQGPSEHALAVYTIAL